MGKLVVLKLGDGSFEQGFPVTLEIGEDERRPYVEIVGKLPPIPEIPQYYTAWATNYRRLGLRSRREEPVAFRLEASNRQARNVSKVEQCRDTAQLLRDRLNTWLASESFRPIREKLLEQLSPTEEIRLIIQTENIWLRRLPWHLWDICDRYPKAEIALSAPVYEQPKPRVTLHSKVRILAILGNSTGINTETDRLLLEQLPDAQISFLVEPQLQELTEELWKQDWDILFFAGHSSSQCDGETGQIYINKTDSLTIDQLKFGLRKAVERGLKIAILNSCDGLGLARDLADLQIPQIVLMREPVPDQVAQSFLKYFLEAFSSGESFYLAVREARERLEGLEGQFPCATWLPMIFQNPAVMPPNWQGLGGSQTLDSISGLERGDLVPDLEPEPYSDPKPKPPRPPWKPRTSLASVFFTSLVITSLVLGIRHLGLLQRTELRSFDHLMRSRPAEPLDNRLLVVEVTEEDIQAQKQELRPGTSLSDRSLTRLLEILESHKPRAIGLDIHRDFRVGAEHQDLVKRLQNSKRFIGVCKVSTGTDDPGIKPPPEVPVERQGFSDVALDPDNVVRRHLFYMTPATTSPCTARYALSTKLVFRYLAAENISPQSTKDKFLRLGEVVFKPLRAPTGGYQKNVDTWGNQVLLNYRFYRSAQDFAPQVTLTQVLQGQLDPKAVKDKVVLIGVTAPSRNDYFYTPYSTGRQFNQQIPGVFVHAQMVSQMLSAVLDGRPLLWIWPMWGEALWIWSWSLVGGLLAWRFQSWLRLGLVVGVLFMLYGFCFGLLIKGGWVPLVPSALVLLFTSGSVVAFSIFPTQRQKAIFALKL